MRKFVGLALMFPVVWLFVSVLLYQMVLKVWKEERSKDNAAMCGTFSFLILMFCAGLYLLLRR